MAHITYIKLQILNFTLAKSMRKIQVERKYASFIACLATRSPSTSVVVLSRRMHGFILY
jgi:hypothetical protein